MVAVLLQYGFQRGSSTIAVCLQCGISVDLQRSYSMISARYRQKYLAWLGIEPGTFVWNENSRCFHTAVTAAGSPNHSTYCAILDAAECG